MTHPKSLHERLEILADLPEQRGQALELLGELLGVGLSYAAAKEVIAAWVGLYCEGGNNG